MIHYTQIIDEIQAGGLISLLEQAALATRITADNLETANMHGHARRWEMVAATLEGIIPFIRAIAAGTEREFVLKMEQEREQYQNLQSLPFVTPN